MEQRIAPRVRAFVGSIALCAAASAAEPLANPNLDLRGGGIVYAVARQPDGGTIVAGSFLWIDGVSRVNIARLQPDGSVDPNWMRPSGQASLMFSGPLTSVAVDGDGSVYVGSNNFAVHGIPWIAKLSGTTGALVSEWRPPDIEFVGALATDAHGGVYVTDGGGIWKLSTMDGSALDHWRTDDEGAVDALAIDADGAVYVGGRFTSLAGVSRSNLARLRDDEVDPDWSPSTDGGVDALALDRCGALYAGGSFANAGGQPRANVAKFVAADGRLDAGWAPSFDSWVTSVATDADCAVYVGGNFKSVGGVPRRHLAKLSSADGEPDSAWNPGASATVMSMVVDGTTLYAGGFFGTIGGASRLGYASLDVDTGAVGIPMDAEFDALVELIVPRPNGGVVIGGRFMKANGAAHNQLLRLQPDGTLDTRWRASIDAFYGDVTAIAVGPDDSVYAGGGFDEAGDGVPRAHVVKFSGVDGSIDAGWDAAADDWVDALAVDANGAVYAGGDFASIGGAVRGHVAKLSATNGAADPSWNASVDAPGGGAFVDALAVDASGAVYASGAFMTVDGQPRVGPIKLSGADGAIDTRWNPPANRVYPLVIGADGAVYAGSQYSVEKYSGVDGSPVSGWNVQVTSVGWISSIALDSRGRLYVAGDFSGLDGQPTTNLARVSAATGEVDATWEPDVAASVVGVGAGDRVYAGGFFSTAGGVPRTDLAAFASDDDGGSVHRPVRVVRTRPFPFGGVR